jgi:hypothetical protein
LGLVLDGALEPAELVLEVLGRFGDKLSCNLDVEESVNEKCGYDGQHPEKEEVVRGVPRQSWR